MMHEEEYWDSIDLGSGRFQPGDTVRILLKEKAGD
jgi:hypothetical protein